MLKKIYSLFDSKGECWATPVLLQSRGEAIRGLMDVAEDQNTTVSKHPEDFCLFELGTFDFTSGKFELHPAPVSIGLACDYIKPKLSAVPAQEVV